MLVVLDSLSTLLQNTDLFVYAELHFKWSRTLALKTLTFTELEIDL